MRPAFIRAIIATVLVLAVAGASRALPVVRKTPTGPWVTQSGPDFFVPAGQTVDWRIRICNDTGGPITGGVTDYLHSGECANHDAQVLVCPPLDLGGGTLLACDDAASPPISQPAVDVQGMPIANNACAEVVFSTRIALLTPPGTLACNVAVYATDAGTPDASGQTSPPSGAGCTCVQVARAVPTAMNLAMSAEVDVLPFVAGDPASTVVYTIDGENLTPRDAQGRFILPIPTGVSYVEALTCPPGATCGLAPTGEFVIDGLVVPEGGAFTARLRVAGNCESVGATRVCAQGWFEPAEDPTARLPTWDVESGIEAPSCFKPASTQVVVTKTYRLIDRDASGTATAGDRVRFLITAWNRGGVPARDVLLVDSIPLGFDRSVTGPQAVTVSPEGVFASGQATWTFGEVGPGTAVSVWVEVTMLVDAVAPNRARLSTRVLRDCGGATVLSDDPLTPAPDDATSVRSAGIPAPSVEKRFSWVDANSDGSPTVGERATFALVVTNRGTAVATGVTLTDALPACLGDATAVRLIGGGEATDASTPRTVTMNDVGGADGLLPDETVEIRFDTTILATAGCCNQATVAWAGGSAPSQDPRAAAAAEPTCLEATHRLLRLAKSVQLLDVNGDGAANPGERVRYRLDVSNDGGPVTDARITDELPRGLTLDVASVSILAPVPPAWSFAPQPGGLFGEGRLDFGPIEFLPGEAAIITFECVLEAASVGTACNVASLLTQGQAAPQSSASAGRGPTCLQVVTAQPPGLVPDLVVSGPLTQACALPGEEATVRVGARVTGGLTATAVRLRLTGLDGLVVLDAGGGVEAPGTITWDFGDVQPVTDLAATALVLVPCDMTGVVSFGASAEAMNVPLVAPASVNIALAGPDVLGTLAFTHDDADGDGVLGAGETLLVDFSLAEIAGCDAGDVSANLAVDPALEVLEARDGGVVGPGSISWTLPTAASGTVTVQAVLGLLGAAPDCSEPLISGSASWTASPGACVTTRRWDGPVIGTPPGPCRATGSDLLSEDRIADLDGALSIMSTVLDAAGVDDSCVDGALTRVDPAQVVVLDVASQLDPGVILVGEAAWVGPATRGAFVLYEVSRSCSVIHACKVDDDGDPGNGRESLRIGVRPCGP